MPIFEYKCLDCGRITEFFEKSTGKRQRKCAECGSAKLKKQFSSFAGIVKQSGPTQPCRGCPSESCPYAGREEAY